MKEKVTELQIMHKWAKLSKLFGNIFLATLSPFYQSILQTFPPPNSPTSNSRVLYMTCFYYIEIYY